MTWREAFVWGRDTLLGKYVPNPDNDARYLLEYTLNIDRSEFLLRCDESINEKDWIYFKRIIEQRKERIPLQYIIGKTEFMGLPFYVNDSVLIPRQDTECMVELLFPMAKNKRVLDLCTGSGCIGISIAALETSSKVFCSDISEEALQIAKKNAKMNKVDIKFICSDLFENVEGKYDIIVSNPPYIKTRELSGLMPEVCKYEPILALDGKEDGLFFYKKIIHTASYYLYTESLLAFEIGCDQGEEVSYCMEKSGFVNIEVKKDLAGLDRIVIGKKGTKERVYSCYV